MVLRGGRTFTLVRDMRRVRKSVDSLGMKLFAVHLVHNY